MMEEKKYNEMSSQEKYMKYGIANERLQNRIAKSMENIENKGRAFALRDAYAQSNPEHQIDTSDDVLYRIVDKLLADEKLTVEEEQIMYENIEVVKRLLGEGDEDE